MNDANFQNFSTVQNNLQPAPVTVASAATIVPSTFVTFVTGTTQVATITPPVTGQHMLALIFTNGSPGATLTSGNIGLATTVVQNKVLLLVYDPTGGKYWPCY